MLFTQKLQHCDRTLAYERDRFSLELGHGVLGTMVLLPCNKAIFAMGRNRTTWKTGSAWQGGETTTIRVPIILKDEILAYARAVDSKLITNESDKIPVLIGDFLEIIDRYIAWRSKNYRSTQLFLKPDITARTWDELRKFQDLLRQSPELLQE